ncbi:MAG: hypothetical protein HY287_07805 [Planctomycetes bacterium]|nr:hypothetical protein [Planctomycetota bacterium]MBI3834216.1 hypothetical protein [Planctomycetota bacterium]
MVNEYLHVGGLVAVGFDSTETYLLTVTHSGRGVFSTNDWKRVARDYALAYPDEAQAIGIGPIEGQIIAVAELVSDRPITVSSPSGRILLSCESSGIEVVISRTKG